MEWRLTTKYEATRATVTKTVAPSWNGNSGIPPGLLLLLELLLDVVVVLLLEDWLVVLLDVLLEVVVVVEIDDARISVRVLSLVFAT